MESVIEQDDAPVEFAHLVESEILNPQVQIAKAEQEEEEKVARTDSLN